MHRFSVQYSLVQTLRRILTQYTIQLGYVLALYPYMYKYDVISIVKQVIFHR